MTNVANEQISISYSHARRYFRKKNTCVFPSVCIFNHKTHLKHFDKVWCRS